MYPLEFKICLLLCCHTTCGCFDDTTLKISTPVLARKKKKKTPEPQRRNFGQQRHLLLRGTIHAHVQSMKRSVSVRVRGERSEKKQKREEK